MMTNKQYHKLADGSLEAFWIFLWYIGISACFTIVIAMATISIRAYMDLPDPSSFAIYVVFPAMAISFPATLLVFYIRKAYNIYEIEQFRNWWVSFSTVLERKSLPENAFREFDKWCAENATSLYLNYNERLFFLKQEDAVAFRLSLNDE